jgi:hypothetical protein
MKFRNRAVNAAGYLSLLGAVGAQAVIDAQLDGKKEKRARADALAFMRDGRFDFICRFVPGVNADAAKSVLIKRGIMEVENAGQ